MTIQVDQYVNSVLRDELRTFLVGLRLLQVDKMLHLPGVWRQARGNEKIIRDFVLFALRASACGAMR